MDYGSTFRATATYYYLTNVSFIVVEEGNSKLVVEYSHKPNFARYWKVGDDRILKTYPALGENSLGHLSPYYVQYRFIHRDVKIESGVAQDPEAVSYRYLDNSVQSTMEVVVPMLPNLEVTATTLVRHANNRIKQVNRSIVEEALTDGPDWKVGDQESRIALNIEFKGAMASYPSVAELIEANAYDRNNRRTRTIVFKTRQVEPIPMPVNISALRETLAQGLREIVPGSYNPYFAGAAPSSASGAWRHFMSLNLPLLLGIIGIAALSIGVFIAIFTRFRRGRKQRGLSLVELLVTVGILGILASLATVHFLHAQVRSKVAKAHSELRVYRDGVLAYNSDYNKLPRMTIDVMPYYDRYEGKGNPFHAIRTTLGSWVTTPIAYLSEFDKLHPFDRGAGDPSIVMRTYGYHERERSHLLGLGPDRFDQAGWGKGGDFYLACPGPAGWKDLPLPRPVYDPTNGVVSDGFLFLGQALNSMQP